MTPVAAILLLQLTQGIAVETDSPDAHCPDLHQTRAAVNARLGTIQSEGFRARYTIVRVRGESPRDFVLLELTGPEGDVRLRRELPVGGSCAAVSEAIALVLDEYFRALVTPEDEATPVEPTRSSRVNPEGDSRSPTKASAPASEPDAWRLTLEMALISSPSRVAAGARVQRLLAGSWHAGLELILPLRERVESLAAGAEARARSVEVNAQLAWGPELGAFRPYIAPTLFSWIERGSTRGALASSTHYRWLGGAGVELGANLRLRGAWQGFAFASGGSILAESADFVVGGDEVLGAIGWTGRLGLGLSHTF